MVDSDVTVVSSYDRYTVPSAAHVTVDADLLNVPCGTIYCTLPTLAIFCQRREDDDRGRRHGSAGGSGGDKKKSGTSNSPNSQAQPPLPSPQPSQPPSPPTPPPSKIEVREHPSRGVFLSGGEGLRVPVSSAEAVEALVSRGAKARATAATSLNDRSSRSHAILILEIEASQSPPSGAAAAAVSLGTSDVGGGNRRGRVPKAGRRRRSIAECVSIGKMQVRNMVRKTTFVKCCLIVEETTWAARREQFFDTIVVSVRVLLRGLFCNAICFLCGEPTCVAFCMSHLSSVVLC